MLGDKPLRRGSRAKRIVRKLNVGLVDHDHAGARIAQGRDKVERRHIARGVIGRGHDRQIALGSRRKHRRMVELKGHRVAPHVAHLGLAQRGKERVLAKARRAVEQGPPRAAKRQQVVIEQLIAAVSRVTPAFGRGEVIDVNGSPVELLLVKNPMGFRLSLASFDPANADTMIAINDEYADGRDMSWLWDVDFTSLRASGVAMVSGVRAWDMALRLGYDQVPVADTNTDLEQAVTAFVNANPGTRKHIYCTYTAMLKTRAVLGRITEVRDAGVGK